MVVYDCLLGRGQAKGIIYKNAGRKASRGGEGERGVGVNTKKFYRIAAKCATARARATKVRRRLLVKVR